MQLPTAADEARSSPWGRNHKELADQTVNVDEGHVAGRNDCGGRMGGRWVDPGTLTNLAQMGGHPEDQADVEAEGKCGSVRQWRPCGWAEP